MTNKNSNLLVIDGGTVKTEENGIVTGLGIVFGSEQEPDQSREKDFFTKESFIMKKSEFVVPLYYNHGVGVINEQIGDATLTKTDTGWNAEARIDTTDEVGMKVYEAVKDRKHGFSTGALQHLVKRESKSNGTNFLKKWVVGELSLTERPAERKAVVQSVKSIDGEAVFETAWPEDTQNTVSIELLDAEGTKIWNSGDDTKNLKDSVGNAKTVNIKDVYGSVEYSLSIYDEDSDRGAQISVYEWGGYQDFIGHLQDVLAVAAAAAAADDKEDTTTASALISINKSKELEAQVEAIVKSILEKNEQDSDTRKQLEEKEAELEASKAALAATEKALADLKYEQYGEILAGAEETINNNKGK